MSEAAKSKAWRKFLAKFPNADKSKFEAQVHFESTNDHTGKAEIYFKIGQGIVTSVFGSDSKYWSLEMKAALGKPSGFPEKLMPISDASLPIPAVSFHSDAPSLKKIFNNKIDIYATPVQYFTTKFREKTLITHRSGKESKKWLAGPNMSYWPQQLNFAVGVQQQAAEFQGRFSTKITQLLVFCLRCTRQTNTSSAWRHSEHKRFARKSNFQSDEQQV